MFHRKWILSPTEAKWFFSHFHERKPYFGKTNYSLLSFSLGTIYEQNMSEIDFSTCATKVDFGRSWLLVKIRDGGAEKIHKSICQMKLVFKLLLLD